jgi:CheY-like chemotaxis protein
MRRSTRLTIVDSIESAVRRSASLPAPDVVVFAMTRPGQFADTDVEHLRQSWSRARLIALLGSWCEGETRSGRPLRDVTRVYAHQWLARMDREPNRGGHLFLRGGEEEAAYSGQRHLALVHSRDVSYAEGLADALAGEGYAAACLDGLIHGYVRGASVIIYDAHPDPATRIAEAAALRQRHQGVPLIALVAAPRAYEIAELVQAGAVAVVSQPFLLGDLIAQIDVHVRANGTTSASR